MSLAQPDLLLRGTGHAICRVCHTVIPCAAALLTANHPIGNSAEHEGLHHPKWHSRERLCAEKSRGRVWVWGGFKGGDHVRKLAGL